MKWKDKDEEILTVNNKYGLDETVGKFIAEENKERAEEFNKDIDEYLLNNSTTINIMNIPQLINHYYNFIINHPNEWIVISNILTPFENESVNLLFEVVKKLTENDYNFERKYNTLKIK